MISDGESVVPKDERESLRKRYLQERDKRLRAFPMLSDLGWLPPCLLLVGGAEVLLDDSRNLADKLKREGAHIEYDGMVHVWTLFSSFLPEGQEGFRGDRRLGEHQDLGDALW